MKQRANVYIDAFNLYYRSLRGTPYKWLDLRYERKLWMRDPVMGVAYPPVDR